MNKKDLAERYLKNINKNVHLNFTLSYRPLQMRSETECKLVHQGIPLVRLVTSVAEKQDILGSNPDLHRSFHLNLFHYIYVPTNANYRDDCICRGWDSHRGVNLTALTAISAQA